jgi:hypothetical protein
MRALPRTAVPVAVGVAVLAAVVLVVDPGGDDSPPAPASPTGPSLVRPPIDPNLDYRDATAVCLRFADTIHRRDARTDSGPQAAYRRAMAYLTGELATAVAAQPEGRDPQWSTWRTHQVATDPTVAPAVADGDVQPADTVTESYRAAHVILTPVGADGWRGPAEQQLVLCTLRADAGRWRIEQYQVTEPPGVS